ncbi:hypothetical protein [Deinococcus aquatilis]|uniref:hypothetical protein n=1 Tax=Deinococcus aquatilis TaxID=519440 RepID=UPI0012FC8ED0|nr:hypothetical protein [Deinococcus aquatilis]
MNELTRKGFLWVESSAGERVQVTDRFRMEYQDGDQLYTVETEPSLDAKPIYVSTLTREGGGAPLPDAEREQVLRRILTLLEFSQDPYVLVR